METILWKDSAVEILGKLRQKRSNAWISNETIHLAADKREARKRGDMTEYKRLRNEVQRLIRRDKNSWLENECRALDQYDRTGKARQLFKKVRKVKKTPLNAKQACINDAQGNIITEQEPASERLREYNEQLFAKPLNETTLAIRDYNVSGPKHSHGIGHRHSNLYYYLSNTWQLFPVVSMWHSNKFIYKPSTKWSEQIVLDFGGLQCDPSSSWRWTAVSHRFLRKGLLYRFGNSKNRRLRSFIRSWLWQPTTTQFFGIEPKIYCITR